MKTKFRKTINLQQKLLERCKKNDRKAQLELYNMHFRAMLNTAYRIVGNSVDAEDVVQEAFVFAFRRLESFIGNVTFGAWLKRIVVNHSIDYLRKNHPQNEWIEDVPEMVEMDESKNDETGPKNFSVEKIKNAMNELPEGYRIILSLYLLEGYDHEEIGQILNIAPSTSRSQYSRAKQKLRENLKKEKI